jgi:hypothetical protein
MTKLLNAREVISQAQQELGMTQKPISTVTNTLDQDISQMLALTSAVADEVLLEPAYKSILGDDIWCTDASGKPKPLGPTTDTDLILLDGRLMIDGLKYRFLKQKGMEFGEEMRDFIVRLNKLAVRANPGVLDLYADEGRQL